MNTLKSLMVEQGRSRKQKFDDAVRLMGEIATELEGAGFSVSKGSNQIVFYKTATSIPYKINRFFFATRFQITVFSDCDLYLMQVKQGPMNQPDRLTADKQGILKQIAELFPTLD